MEKECKHVWAKTGTNITVRLGVMGDQVYICMQCGHSDKYLGLKITREEAHASILANMRMK